MKKFVNGKYVKMTPDEINELKSITDQHDPQLSYGELVNIEIRKRYSESDEFAILRQRDEKPEEFAEYYAYCEECKTKVKEAH